MWRLWSRPLEWLGRIRLYLRPRRTKLLVGHRDAFDAQGTARWRDYLSPERLYDTWGPVPGSPWMPFHCVPLFAALDRIPVDDVGPAPGPELALTVPTRRGIVLPAHARHGATRPPWITPDSWTILDLPGPLAVEVAAWLIEVCGCQPVCTFDNWPHPKGLIHPEDTLAELLRWASTVDDERPMLSPTAPPLWICDSERLGPRSGRPGEFDNRYYLDDSVLPGMAMLARAGVRRVIYVVIAEQNIPTLDLEGYFADLLAAGVSVEYVDLADPTLEPRPLASVIGARRFQREGFHRSAAGGFGSEVPQPSSGSGS
jgi:hypothetical protein